MGNLTEKRVGDKVIIDRVEGPETELVQRLWQIGFLPQEKVEVVHRSPLSAQSCVVKVKGVLVALSQVEADHIFVQ